MHQDEGLRKETSELLRIENRVPTFTPINNLLSEKTFGLLLTALSESVCQSTSVWKAALTDVTKGSVITPSVCDHASNQVLAPPFEGGLSFSFLQT